MSSPSGRPGAQAGSGPLCSVCIANYNGIGLIEDCIASVLAQDLAAQVEIIVHDDASPDGSAAYIKEHYPQVTLIESRDNVGFCIANNRMAQAAQGRYLLLLNNDAALLPGALATLLAQAAALAQPAILSLPQYDAQSGALIDLGSALDPFLNTIPNRELRNSDVATVMGACLWLPRSLWQELGGFPDWFGSIAEDTLLCCKARLHGYRVMVVAESGFRHHVGKSLGGGKAKDDKLQTATSRRRLSERNKNFVIVMTYPAPMLQLILPLHMLLLIMEGVVLSTLLLRPRLFTTVYLASLYALWTHRTRLCEERRLIQTHRRIGRRDFFSEFRIWPQKLRLLWRHGVPRIR